MCSHEGIAGSLSVPQLESESTIGASGEAPTDFVFATKNIHTKTAIIINVITYPLLHLASISIPPFLASFYPCRKSAMLKTIFPCYLSPPFKCAIQIE
jgi:hypothetical protein